MRNEVLTVIIRDGLTTASNVYLHGYRINATVTQNRGKMQNQNNRDQIFAEISYKLTDFVCEWKA